MDVKYFESFAIDIAHQAGDILMAHLGALSSIEEKSTAIDLVTEADLSSEKCIIEAISHSFPDHDIISEEQNIDLLHSDYKWVIDPLDGTTNFVHTLPLFAISIGLHYKDETIVGVVYNPASNQCFHAAIGHGAYLNQLPIHVSDTQKFNNSLIVTGFPYLHDDKWKLSFELFQDMYARNQGMRRLGAASLDFCFVAAGQFDAFYEFNLKPWDISAGDIILREAGGQTSDWDGSTPMPFSGNRILASNGILHTQVSDILLQEKYALFLD